MESAPETSDPICPLCLRTIPAGVPQSRHHLIPRLALTEAEIARDYDTPEKLRAHPRIAKFAAWVAKRPPDFVSRTPGGPRRKR